MEGMLLKFVSSKKEKQVIVYVVLNPSHYVLNLSVSEYRYVSFF